jgi:uncharacterized circularly permuted ATP-grasp superfamily protein
MQTKVSKEESKQHQSQFFIKSLASKKCCFMILGYAYHKEEVENLLKLLSKAARNYYQQNAQDIDGLKSIIDHTLSYPLDFNNQQIKRLNLMGS